MVLFEADAPYGGFSTPRFTVNDADDFIRPHVTHWLVCNETYMSPRRMIIGYTWRLLLQEEETCVYASDDTVIVGFRGTHTAKDLYDDMKLSINSVFPRALQGVIFVQSLLASLESGVSVELCGHSLGGAIAREVGGRLSLPVVTFNAASPPTSPAVSTMNEIDYHIVFDIISAWQSPNTVRIDKGFRPLPAFWQRLTPFTWLHASLSDVIASHSLSNFSNQKYGRVICGEDETRLFRQWMRSLPSYIRTFVYFTVFGVSGVQGLPRMEGCYGLHLNST